MTWKLEVNMDKEIAIYLYRQTPLPIQLYVKYAVTFYSDRVPEGIVRKSGKLRNFSRLDDGWGWGERLFDLSDLSHSDPQGSFNLKVETDFFEKSDGVTEILPGVDKCTETGEVESSKIRKEIFLKQMTGLLGDEVTSDVIVYFVDKENVEIGDFFCHSAVSILIWNIFKRPVKFMGFAY